MPAADIRTLIAANATVWCACTALLEFLRRTGRTYPGFGLWTLSIAAGAVGFLLGSLRLVLPEAASILAANGVLAGSMVLLLAGGRAFLGKRMPWTAILVAWLAQECALGWFYWARPSLTYRILTVTAFSVPVLVLVAKDFLSAEARRYGAAARFIVWSTASFALVATVRAASTYHAGFTRPLEELFDARVIQTVYFSSILVAGLLLSFGAVLLNHRRLQLDLEGARDRLQASLDVITAKRAKIRVLEGFLPICSSCKRICGQDGTWFHLESYIRDHSEADFSHGICPECAKRLYPDETHDTPS